MSLSERTKSRIHELGYKSLREFSRKLNVPYQPLQLICKGKQTHSKYVDKIAFGLNTTVDFLMSGVVKSKGMPTVRTELQEYGLIKDILPLVPVIEWKEALTWRGIVMTQQELKKYEMVPLFSKASQKSYALKINNDAMVSASPSQDSFKLGDIIIIDPEVKPKIGQFVIASVKNKEAIFRQLVDIGGVKCLLPLNPIYKIKKVTQNVRIIGVLSGSFRQHG